MSDELPAAMQQVQPIEAPWWSGYNSPPEFKNIPFNEAWMTRDGLPFGLEDWAREFMQPNDFGTGLRVVEHANGEPSVHTFRVKREPNGDIDIQYNVSVDEYFSLRPNSAVLIRRAGGADMHPLTMAKWMPMLYHNVRKWEKLWERKIVRYNVCPNLPATNGAMLDFLQDNVRRLLQHYKVPAEGLPAFDWEQSALMGSKKARDRMLKDTTPTNNHLLRTGLAFYEMEDRLKQNCKDLSDVQILAEFQHLAFTCKSLLGLAVAQGLISVE